jgi:hypothetical protein
MTTFWVNASKSDGEPLSVQYLKDHARTLHSLPEVSEEFDVSTRTEDIESQPSPQETLQETAPRTGSTSAEDVWVRKVVQQERTEQIKKATERLNQFKVALKGTH